ncbi:MAG: hypothetical protein GF421_11675 [Candidatus Aminicenantes bacterium]|nr:hypothetical protein [Candidatus Aminicenantes bacterium]
MEGEMEKHIKILSVLWIVSGALGLIWAFFIFWILFGISFIPDIGYEAPIILRTIGIWATSFIAVLSIPDIIAGLALLKKKEWGRLLTLALAFFNLLCFPFGTALGIYSLVILFNDETIQLFNK